MILAMGIIALGVTIVLAGGPSELLLAIEHALSAVISTIHQAWLTFIG